MLYKNFAVLTEKGYINEDILVEDGRIKALGKIPGKGFDGTGKRIIPGLFDIHTHGGYGYDFNSAKNLEEMEKILDFYYSSGVTSVFPTLLTDHDEVFMKQLPLIVELAKRHPIIKGIHLEGPFLSVEFKGAQPEECLQKPSLSVFERYQKQAQGLVKYITIAPELEGSVAFTKAVTKEGVVVSLGHSAATFDETSAAVQAGAKNFTHVMNAMKGIHQHFPSILSAAFYYDNCYNELIMDGIHVVPEMVEFVTKIKTPERVIGVTDSLMAAGLPDGSYYIGFTPITVKNGDCTITATGVRAGSTLRAIAGFRNFQKFTGRGPEQAAETWSLNPAKLFGMDREQGSLEVGKKADFDILDGKDNLLATYIGGEKVYDGEEKA
jgi:N-acetylglucosamine-6-phosphate deacetylase